MGIGVCVSSNMESEEIVEIGKPQIAKAVVEFRIQNNYRGEFGFDWMRIDDKGVDSFDGIYYDILEGGYKTPTEDMSKDEAYKRMRKDYNPHKIKMQTRAVSSPDDVKAEDEYYVPYLSLFSQPFCEKMEGDLYNSPQSSATLQVLVEIEEDIDRLEFKYNKQYIEIDKPVLKDKLKCNKKLSADKTITITCIADIPSLLAGAITVYAYPKGGGSSTLAGKLQVMPNSEGYRKKQKIVLVKVKTFINETQDQLNIRKQLNDLDIEPNKIKKGEYDQDEIQYLAQMLHQALVYVEIADNNGKGIDLNLTNDENFKQEGKYVKGSSLDITNKDQKLVDGVWQLSGFSTYAKEVFYDQNSQFKDAGYLPIFFYGVPGGFAAGSVESINIYDADTQTWETQFRKGANIYAMNTSDIQTTAHEVLHAFMLKHTHRDGSPLADCNIKYIYPSGQRHIASRCTANVMAYVGPNRLLTWKWQWDIIHKNV